MHVFNVHKSSHHVVEIKSLFLFRRRSRVTDRPTDELNGDKLRQLKKKRCGGNKIIKQQKLKKNKPRRSFELQLL